MAFARFGWNRKACFVHTFAVVLSVKKKMMMMKCKANFSEEEDDDDEVQG
jgi:hypothetical protein